MHTPDFERLAKRVHGELVRPGDVAYEHARRVNNLLFDRRPACIARCSGVEDVVACVEFAREYTLPLAVRGGGNGAAGAGTCEGGVVVDLSLMRAVDVNPETRMARVEGGATWGEVDRATHRCGLATPGCAAPAVGVGGSTLGGGIGHLTRRYGLAIDNLLAAEVVLADGRIATASADTSPDLFWAIRGGGGNFGVVTSFVFRLYRLAEVIAGVCLWPLDRTGDALRFYREFIPRAPEDLNGIFALFAVPVHPAFPERLRRSGVCGIFWCWTGDPAELESVVAPLRAFERPALETIGRLPYPDLQAVPGAVFPCGPEQHWRGDFFSELGEDAISAHAEYAVRMPASSSAAVLYPVDGAARRSGRNDTAYSFREAAWAEAIASVNPEWASEFWAAVHPHSAGAAYVNFMQEEGEDRVRAAYRENHGRLAAIKAKYDALNLFRLNQNIRPAAAAAA